MQRFSSHCRQLPRWRSNLETSRKAATVTWEPCTSAELSCRRPQGSQQLSWPRLPELRVLCVSSSGAGHRTRLHVSQLQAFYAQARLSSPHSTSDCDIAKQMSGTLHARSSVGCPSLTDEGC